MRRRIHRQLLTTVFAGGALAALPFAANAADMPVKAPPRAVAAAVFSWTGLYAGIHGGYGWGDADYNFPGDIPAGFGGFNGIYSPNGTGGTFSRRVSGGVFGGHAGYNQQYGNIVLGLEASIAWSGLKGTAVDPFVPALGAGRTYKTKLDWFATLTPRLGYASGNWLFYAKAGLAAGQVVSDLTSTQVAVPILFHERNGHVGWTAGAGVEHALTPNWIVGLEYNYVDLGTEQYGGIATQNGAFAARGQYDVSLTYHTVLARLSYKANAPAAVAAVSGMPTKALPVVVAAAGPWSGFYAGAHGGYGWGDADYAFPPGGAVGNLAPAGGGEFRQSIRGGLVGGHLGGNYQTGNWLVGVEGAFAWSGIKGSSQDVFPVFAATTETYNTKLEWLATATPRLGYVSGNWLFYGKGGLAVGRAESRATSVGPQTTQFQEKTEHVGWTAGAGIEHALTPNWIFGLEYNYVDLGKEKYGGHRLLDGANSAGPEYFVDLKFSTVLARFSYKFGPAPVVARY